MTLLTRSRIETALDILVRGGLPWSTTPAPGTSDFERRFRRHARHLIMRRWPVLLRPFAALAMALLWPFSAARNAILVARHSPLVAAGTIPAAGLAVAALGGALARNVHPIEFAAFGMLDSRYPADAWMLGDEATRVLAALAEPPAIALADDKHAFAEFCARTGIPAVPTLATVGPHGMVMPFQDGSWPPQDLVSKPRRAARTEGLAAWTYADGTYRDRERDTAPAHAPQALVRHLVAMARIHGEMLVQPVLRAHPDLSELSGVGVPTARMVTGLWPDGTVSVIDALAQRPLDGAFAAQGSLFALVELATGRVRDDAEGQLRPGLHAARLDRPFAGRLLPGWDAAVRHVLNGHRAFPARAVMLGWDVAFTVDGPVVIETNIGLSFFQFQMASLRPALRGRAGELLRAWL